MATGDTISSTERFNEALKGDSIRNVTEAALGLYYGLDRVDPAADDAADGIEGMGDQAESAEDRIARLSDIIRGFGDTELDAREAARRLEQAYDDLADSVEENGTTLDITTQAGRDNQDALDAIAKAARDNAVAIVENTGSQEQATAAMQAGREELIRQLEQFGITGAEAEAYADKLGLIPENITTEILAETATAKNQVINFADTVRDVPGSKVTTMSALTDVARQGVRSLIDEIAQVKSKTVTITANRALNFVGGGGR